LKNLFFKSDIYDWAKTQIKIKPEIMNLEERVNKTYLDLYRDDEADVVNSLALIEYELKKSGQNELVLEFHDWDFQQQNHGRTKDWYKDLCFDLLRRSVRFDFDCFGALYEYIGMNPDNPFFLTLVETAIHFSSYNAIDFLMKQLPNSNYPVKDCGITAYTLAHAMSNPQVASYLLENYPVNVDGLHSVDDEMWADYTDVLSTCDHSSVLVSIMLSPYLDSHREKLNMLNVAIQNGASVYGHSPAEFPSILSPLSIASELCTEFVDFFLALNVIPEVSNLFVAVSSPYTSFEEKKDILELLSVATGIDFNHAVSKEGRSLVEQAISNCSDADLIDWLILQDEYNYSSSDFTYLMTLAHKHHNFDIRDHIMINHGGSESVYTKLLIDEENVWRNAEM
jgi:hypothetical protein